MTVLTKEQAALALDAIYSIIGKHNWTDRNKNSRRLKWIVTNDNIDQVRSALEKANINGWRWSEPHPFRKLSMSITIPLDYPYRDHIVEVPRVRKEKELSPYDAQNILRILAPYVSKKDANKSAFYLTQAILDNIRKAQHEC